MDKYIKELKKISMLNFMWELKLLISRISMEFNGYKGKFIGECL